MLSSHLLLALGWIGFFFIHSLMADKGTKNRFRKKMGASFKFYRLIYSIAAIGLLAPLLYLQVEITSLKLWGNSWLTITAGTLLTTTGLCGMIICLKKYLVSPEGFKDLFFEGARPELQVRGLHRFVRHPLYLSTFVLLGGMVVFFPLLSNLIVYLLMIAYVLLAIPLEESKLVELYGDAYLRYREEVPALVPDVKVRGERR
jgi:protein-S-isoprenylcysteine O-methyltransferase Ste14